MDPLSTCLLMAYKAETDRAERWKKQSRRKKGRQTHPNKCSTDTVRKMDDKHTIWRRRITGEKKQEKQEDKK